MTGYRVCQYSLLSLVVYLLLGCQSSDRPIPSQQVLEWPEQRLVFIADSRTGQVKSFFLGNGAPVLFAQTRSDQRTSVRELRLDSSHNQLWVLGENNVEVYEARNLALQKRLPLDAQEIASAGIATDRGVFFAKANSFFEATVR